MIKALTFLIVISLSVSPVFSQSTSKPGAQRTAILGAFSDETKLLLTHVQNKHDTVIQQIRFTLGTLRGRPVVVALSGIGKVNAAITTTLMLEHFRPREFIFTGIAGAVDPALSPGDIVIGTEVGYHDYGATTPDSLEHWRTRNPITNEQNPYFFPCDKKLIALALQAAQHTRLQKLTDSPTSKNLADSVTPSIRQGRIVTGDQFMSSETATAALYTKLQATATEMEGASVAQTCWQQHVPFLVIRSMSDKAGNGAYKDYKTFYQVAARNSANLVMNMVERLAGRRLL